METVTVSSYEKSVHHMDLKSVASRRSPAPPRGGQCMSYREEAGAGPLPVVRASGRLTVSMAAGM